MEEIVRNLLPAKPVCNPSSFAEARAASADASPEEKSKYKLESRSGPPPGSRKSNYTLGIGKNHPLVEEDMIQDHRADQDNQDQDQGKYMSVIPASSSASFSETRTCRMIPRGEFGELLRGAVWD